MSKIVNKMVAAHDRFVAAHREQIEASHELARRGTPVIAGGVDTPVHPLGPPTVDGQGNITIPQLLANPTRINRMVMDLTLQRFVLDRLFTFGGGVSGGAVLYDQVLENELYLKEGHSVQSIAPAAEYPVVVGEHAIPRIAAVEKWGGKGWITDEARDRNDIAYFQRVIRQMSNTIVLKLNTYAMAKADALVAASGRTDTSVDWGNVVTAGNAASSAENWPLATFAAAAVQAEEDEMGTLFNLVILNPQQWGQLITIYGGLSNLREVLGELGFTIYVTNRQQAGKAKFVAEGQVGGYRLEQPLQTVTYRGSAGEDTDRTFTKTSVRPVAYADNAFAIYEYTGLNG
jgi:hypothetical protein